MTGILKLPDKTEVPVTDGLTLGRVKGCDIVLADTKASRKHARIIVEGSVVEIEDLGSSNGTFLNDQKIRRRVLRPGDTIRIGTTEMLFVEAGGSGGKPPDEESGELDLGGEPDGGELDLGGDPDGGAVGLAPDNPAPSPRDVPGVVGLEGDPVQAAEPRSSGDDDVEVLEFVDEVVEVRRREEPARERPSRAAEPPARGSSGGREHGVLQFSRKPAERGGLLGDDMAQMSTGMRLLLGALALAVAGGLGYVAMIAMR